ncbi:hypothetical protein [Clostridium felsineum]|uniref:hypothetical protein n=1 Tax=Clostridium felsineum TaxID=36839 RepID=UPI00098CEC8A|nr:hypothetical protein [Clostridium felsineum]URZ03230.1 hypothetical protein CLAUR_032760 [Clostridium felsineum]
MDSFRSILKKRISIMGAVNGLAIIFIVLTAMYTRKASSTDTSDMIDGFQVGLALGIEIIMIMFIAKYNKALKDENELKKLHIKENDERERFINDKIGVVGFYLALGIIGVATVIAGFINQIIFFTLAGVLIFMTAVKVGLKVYYKNKF